MINQTGPLRFFIRSCFLCSRKYHSRTNILKVSFFAWRRPTSKLWWWLRHSRSSRPTIDLPLIIVLIRSTRGFLFLQLQGRFLIRFNFIGCWTTLIANRRLDICTYEHLDNSCGHTVFAFKLFSCEAVRHILLMSTINYQKLRFIF